jgi:hypothetical protein
MKKYILTAGITLLAMSSAYADDINVQVSTKTSPTKLTMKPARAMAQGSMTMPMAEPTITTGDVTIDAKIKVLQTEMQAKIKAIREEYHGRIKVLVGDKPISISAQASPMMQSSTTAHGDDRGRMMQGSTTMRGDDHMEINGSSTTVRPLATDGNNPMRHDGDKIPSDKQVRGESTSADASGKVQAQTGIRGFFSRFFGK